MMKIKERLSPIAMSIREKPKRSNLYLSTGTEVEVCSDEEGFKGSWYTGTIVESPFSSSRTPYATRNGKAWVQYHTLVSDDDPNEPLKELVDVSFIRPPPPPPESDTIFEQLDVVDAFHRDGWWKGVISQVQILDDKKNSKKYTVIFENPPEQFSFQSKHLRFHLLWKDGKWVRPPKQKRMEGLKFIKGMEVEVNFDKEKLQDAWFPATILEEVGFNSFSVQYDFSRHGGNDRMKETVDSFHIRLPPLKLEVNFQILEAVDVFHDSCWRYGTITKVLTEGRYSVFMRQLAKELQFNKRDLRPCLHLMNGLWVPTREISNGIQTEDSAHADINAIDSQVVVCTENSSTALTHTEKRSLHRKSSAARYRTEEKSPYKRLRRNPLELSTPPLAASRHNKKLKIAAPESEETLASFSKKFRKENSAKSSEICQANLMPVKSTKQDVTDNTPTKYSMPYLDGNLPSAGSDSPCKRKNNSPNQQEVGLQNGVTGSPQKREMQLHPQVTSHFVPVTVIEDKRNEDSIEVIAEAELIKNYSSSSILLAERRASLEEISHNPPHEEINVQKESDMVGLQEQGEQHNFSEGSATMMDFEDASREAELPTAAGMEHEDRTEKVVTTAVGASSDPANNDQALSVFVEEAEDINQNVRVNKELVNSQEVPFVKSSSIWQHIESLEVFQCMPQKPHFSPLLENKEVAREGLAIGHMLTFVALVEKTSKLQVEDPLNLFDSYLEALTDLEMLGFDVKAVKDRVNELLSIKNRQEQLKNQSKDVHTRIAEYNNEKAKLEEEIKAIEKMMKELEEKLDMSRSLKIAKHSEICALEMDAKDINEAILNINQDFGSLAAALW